MIAGSFTFHHIFLKLNNSFDTVFSGIRKSYPLTPHPIIDQIWNLIIYNNVKTTNDSFIENKDA